MTETTPKPAWKNFLFPGFLVALLAVVVIMSNRPAVTPENLPVVVTGDEFNDGVKKATEMVKDPFEKNSRGEELTPADAEKLKEATRLIDSLSRYKPTNLVTYLYAGKAYRILGDTVPAKERFLQVIANRDFDNSDAGKAIVAEAQYEASQILLLSDKTAKEYAADLNKAFELADAAAKAYPNSAIYLAARASVEIQTNKTENAVKDIASALIIDPTCRQALQLKRLMELSAAKKKTP